MNKRIRELEKQAEEYADSTGLGFAAWRSAQLNKFAELIVRECAELTLDHKNDNYYAGWLDYRDEIRRHFGVDQ